jgi:hypothetical protein
VSQDKEKAKAAAKLGALGLAVLSPETETEECGDFVGGLARLEAKLTIRNKALAAAGVAHLKPLTVYVTELFDRALDKTTSKSYRAPNTAEVIAADRQAWEEIMRLVDAKRGDVDSCILHVSKAGGLLSSLLRPVPCEIKQVQVNAAMGYVFSTKMNLLPFAVFCQGPQQKEDNWKGKVASSWKDNHWNKSGWKRGVFACLLLLLIVLCFTCLLRPL